MAELYFYATPQTAQLTLTLDSGYVLTGVSCEANGRSDAFYVLLPDYGPASQGALLQVRCDGYTPFEGRGILRQGQPPEFLFDDIRLQAVPVAPTPPQPNPNQNPFDIIRAVYEQSDFDLGTKEGCGEYTEACVEALHTQHFELWGHIRKRPEQNQWQGHAVDAIQVLAKAGDTNAGIYDVILDTESPNAAPAWSYKGGPEPDLYYYGPMPCPQA